MAKLANSHNETTTLVYDDAGRKTLSQQANGTKASMAYDAANRMSQVVNLKSTNATLSYYNYGFDRIGDRTSIWDNGTDVSNWNYDLTGQLTNDVIMPCPRCPPLMLCPRCHSPTRCPSPFPLSFPRCPSPEASWGPEK